MTIPKAKSMRQTKIRLVIHQGKLAIIYLPNIQVGSTTAQELPNTIDCSLERNRSVIKKLALMAGFKVQ